MHSHKEHEPELSGAERELMAALGRLRPCAPGLSPERLMFQAGERAGRQRLRRRRWLEGALALMLAASLAGNGLLLGRATGDPAGGGAVAVTPLAQDSATTTAVAAEPVPDQAPPMLRAPAQQAAGSMPTGQRPEAPRPVVADERPLVILTPEQQPSLVLFLPPSPPHPLHPMSSLALRETALRQGMEALPVPPGGGEVLRASDAWTYPDLLPRGL